MQCTKKKYQQKWTQKKENKKGKEGMAMPVQKKQKSGALKWLKMAI